jgi:Asp-tRNA(Asn)/Glu-tRNA(Gln) amidotransferase A subunit family amidase
MPISSFGQPTIDAASVQLLRAAGALLLGKTALTEYCSGEAPLTLNPNNPKHTPGGSSSGSAAAVAAHVVSVATGSQTLGSVIRPAAYCGVFGFKPTFGAVPRHGLLRISTELDTVGWFARCIADLRLMLAAHTTTSHMDFWGQSKGALSSKYDKRVYTSQSMPVVKLQEEQAGGAQALVLVIPESQHWKEASAEAVANLEAAADAAAAAGASIRRVRLPAIFDRYQEHAKVC